MTRIVATILLISTLCGAAYGQIEFAFSSQNVDSPGGTVDVDVVVSGFTDIVTMQFSLNWDADVFSYNSVENITDVLPEFNLNRIGTPPGAAGVDDGELTVSWSLNSTQPATIPDGTRLFTLRLFAQGVNCDETQIVISNTPRVTEVVSQDITGPPLTVTTSGGNVKIDDGTCSGGGTMGVGLLISDAFGARGDNVCIPVTTRNFDSIASVMGGITWDPAVLSFTGINNGGLTSIVVNGVNSSSGELKILWTFMNEAITLADGATLFELCYDVLGSTSETSTISWVNLPSFDIEVAHISGSPLPFATDSGTFTVGDDGGGNQTGVGLIFGDSYTGTASSVCIPLTTLNFIDVAALQGGITFDPAVLDYTSIMDGGVTGTQVNASQKDQGDLFFLWTQPSDINVLSTDIDDGGTIFNVCFDVVGNDGDVSSLSMASLNNTQVLEVVGEIGEELTFFTEDGSVTIGDAPESVVLRSSTHTVDSAEMVCVDISVNGFTNVEGLGFSITWDDQVLDFVEQRNYNLPSFGPSNFNSEGSSSLRISYTPVSPVTVASGTSIVQLCFTAIGSCSGGSSSLIDFTGSSGNQLEVIGPGSSLLAVTTDPGTVTIECPRAALDVLNLVDPTCPGDLDGSVSVDFTGTTGAVTCVWTDANGNQVSGNCNLVGVGGGAYTLNASDESGQTITQTVTLANPAPITIDATTNDVTCDAPSSILLAVTGGTTSDGTYNYNWTNGLANQSSFSGIAAGTYSVTVSDDNSCTESTSVTIEDRTIAIESEVTPITNKEGNNGGIGITGMTDGLTFAWSTGSANSSITDLDKGTYTVTVTRASDDCESVFSFDLDFGAVFADEVVSDVNAQYNGFGVSCNGESDGIINGAVVGGCDDGPIVIRLNGNAVTLPVTGLSSGQHVLMVEDACGNTDEVTFTIEEPTAISLVGTEEIECTASDRTDGVLQLTIEGGSGIYTITSGSGTVNNSLARIENLRGGIPFTVIVEDDNGCQAMFQGLEVEICDLPDICEATPILSPNGDGLNDVFEIGCLDGSNRGDANQLTVYNRWGQLVFNATDYDNTWTGTDNSGVLLDEGGYMWALTVGTGQQLFRGSVSILR